MKRVFPFGRNERYYWHRSRDNEWKADARSFARIFWTCLKRTSKTWEGRRARGIVVYRTGGLVLVVFFLRRGWGLPLYRILRVRCNSVPRLFDTFSYWWWGLPWFNSLCLENFSILYSSWLFFTVLLIQYLSKTVALKRGNNHHHVIYFKLREYLVIKLLNHEHPRGQLNQKWVWGTHVQVWQRIFNSHDLAIRSGLPNNFVTRPGGQTPCFK